VKNNDNDADTVVDRVGQYVGREGSEFALEKVGSALDEFGRWTIFFGGLG